MKSFLLLSSFILLVSGAAKAQEGPWELELVVTPNRNNPIVSYTASEFGWDLYQTVSENEIRSCVYRPNMRKIYITTSSTKASDVHVMTQKDVDIAVMDNHIVDSVIKSFPSFVTKSADGKSTTVRLSKVINEGDKSNKNYESAKIIYSVIAGACR